MNGVINKKTVGGFFLIVLILLIFFSKTIYAHSLPVVTGVKPSNGRLTKLETSSGLVDWKDVEKLYSPVAGTVSEVLVDEGETVTEGQELIRFSFSREDTERKLKEIENSKSKLRSEIQNINMNIEKTNRSIADLKAEVYEEDRVSTSSLETLNINIRIKQEEQRKLREQYDAGELSEDEFNEKRKSLSYDLQKLYIDQEEQEIKLKEQQESAKSGVETKEKARETKLLDYQQELAKYDIDLKNKNIDMDNLLMQEEPYLKLLEDYDAYASIRAPATGTLVSLGAEKHDEIKENQLIASIASEGKFMVECNISIDNNFVSVGNTCELSNTSLVIRGTVTKLTASGNSKTVRVEFESADASAGETFDIKFESDSRTTYTVIPNGALNQDNDGYFLYQIKRRDGILGKEYYISRLDVYIGDSDTKNTVIIRGLTFFEPVVLVSDVPVGEGDVIMLENAGDFFES